MYGMTVLWNIIYQSSVVTISIKILRIWLDIAKNIWLDNKKFTGM